MVSILIDNPQNYQGQPEKAPGQSKEAALVQWVMSRVDRWRTARDANFKDRWDEYYRLFRGRWNVLDKNRNSERSRMIAPALSQAIEMTVAEMEEATFGREQWFDVQDDDKEDQDALTARDSLLYDFSTAKVPRAIAECYLNGALYGNLIAKIRVEKTEIRQFGPDNKIIAQPRVLVMVDPIPADEFVPDPSGRNIDEMLGCAHELVKPKHYVAEMQTKGEFFKGSVGGMAEQDTKGITRSDLEQPITQDDGVFITEYHGLVPAKYLSTGRAETAVDKALDVIVEKTEDGDGPLVEAIVVIANKSILLKANKNPFLMGDRSIVACQHDRISGRFWGRGVAEKGYNPQKGLDTELRARQDALGLISNPMMGVNITQLASRGLDLRVFPGKVWPTITDPSAVLSPVTFAGLDPSTFNQSGELERMVQMGTGAMDTATPVKQNERNATATGTSLMVGAFIKRSKRAMANVSDDFLAPIVQKALWRYMQFDPQRYPRDYQFRVIATSGIMAREFEQNQLTQLMGQVPDEMAAPKLVLLKAIIDQSSSTIKNELKQTIDEALKPDPQQQQMQKQAQMMQFQAAQLDLQNKELENQKLQAERLLLLAKVKTEAVRADLEDDDRNLEAARILLERQQVKVAERQADISERKVEVEAKKAAKKGE